MQPGGKHYNYFRDYDPATGAYLQPDPLGVLVVDEPEFGPWLASNYSYVGASPLTFLDPDGARRIPWGKICNVINIGTHAVCDISHRCTYEMDSCAGLVGRGAICYSCLVFRKIVQRCHSNRGTPQWESHQTRIEETQAGCQKGLDVISKNCCGNGGSGRGGGGGSGRGGSGGGGGKK